jgi:hypothetical protein
MQAIPRRNVAESRDKDTDDTQQKYTRSLTHRTTLVTNCCKLGLVLTKKPDKEHVRLLTRLNFFGLDPLTWR